MLDRTKTGLMKVVLLLMLLVINILNVCYYFETSLLMQFGQ